MGGDDAGYRIAVGGVGLALVASAIAAGLGFVAGHDPPQAFWTIVSGLSGGLLGLLAPTPTPKSGDVAAAHKTAAQASGQAAVAHLQAAAQVGLAPGDQAAAAESAATAATASAASYAQAVRAEKTNWLAFALLLVLFVIFELVLLFVPPAKDVSSQLLELASAAAGAAIGLLGPSPKA
jgi:hypothetical protein